MKKRFLACAAAIALSASAMPVCLACGGDRDDSGSGSGVSADSATQQLRFGSKYIDDGYVGSNEDQYYLIFNKNGTGSYRVYDKYSYLSTVEIDDYVINFKYTYVDAAKTKVACYYDSVTYNAQDNQRDANAHWSRVFEVSENVLVTQGQYGYNTYINENYLTQIPNFGKKTD